MKKKIIIIIGILALIIIGFIVLSSYCRKLNETEQANVEEKINPENKQALILYQDSLGTTVKDNVEAITNTLEQSGYSIIRNHPRSDLNYSIQDYEVIVLVSPVYARKLAQPLLNFTDKQDFTGKKVYGVIVGMMKQEGQEKKLEEHIKNAAHKETIKVIGYDKTQMIETLEGLISE